MWHFECGCVFVNVVTVELCIINFWETYGETRRLGGHKLPRVWIRQGQRWLFALLLFADSQSEFKASGKRTKSPLPG